MKYWRGYLIAAVFAAITVGLMQLAERYTSLVDMFYPYLTRTLQGFLAEWSGSLAFNLWQVLLVLALVLLLTTIVLMVLLKWNFFQWLGWTLAVCSMVFFLHTGAYGLNAYAGPLADDLRLDVSEFSAEDMAEATEYFQQKANELAPQMRRNNDDDLIFAEFDSLAKDAGKGFQSLVFDQYYSVFAGPTQPVKRLDWANLYTSIGVTSMFVPLTGEAAVNPQTPTIALPFAMCREMARRMSIYQEEDANFAAFLTCLANESQQFQYSAYVMAYHYCMEALKVSGVGEAAAAAARIQGGEHALLTHDLQSYQQFFDSRDPEATDLAEKLRDAFSMNRVSAATQREGQEGLLLTNWYIQEFILPDMEPEDILGFDPMDESILQETKPNE